MLRDMELVRKILFAIEEQYVDVAIYDLEVEGYDMKSVAYHCKLLYDAGLITDYKGQYYANELGSFGVGSLTWAGHDYLEKIRDETVWKKTKQKIKEKGLPMLIDTIREISSAIVSGMIQGAIKP